MTQTTDKSRKSGRDANVAAAFDPNGVIGRKLQSFYEVIETEPVPPQLLDLLEKLDEAERKANG